MINKVEKSLEKRMQSPNFLIENGLRKVGAYYYGFRTHVKRRWVNRTLIDVFTEELGKTWENVHEDIRQELLYVVGDFGTRNVNVIYKGLCNLKDRKLQGRDVIYNISHIHEPSIPYPTLSSNSFSCQQRTGIEIIYSDDDILVVNKPSGIPTHPSGSYRYNTVTEILKHELGYSNLWPCHRLDKPTSGVLIFATNSTAARKYSKLVKDKDGSICKQYIARIEGKFHDGNITYKCPVFSLNSGGYLMQSNVEKLPVNSTTIFERINYNSKLNQSIVLCTPLTGRMHQIRIHLRNLGYPIANDYLYNEIQDNSTINKLKLQIERYLYSALFEMYPEFRSLSDEPDVYDDRTINLLDLTKFYEDPFIRESIERLRNNRKSFIESLKTNHNESCPTCGVRLFNPDSEFENNRNGIYLHSIKYKSTLDTRLCFETEFPKWSNI